MTEREISEISRVIGALQATVAHLTSQWERNDRDATEGRRALHNKFDELKDALTAALTGVENKVSQISGRVDTLTVEVGTLKPLRDKDQQAIGSKKTLALIWAALIGVIGATAGAAVEIVHLLWPVKPPLH